VESPRELPPAEAADRQRRYARRRSFVLFAALRSIAVSRRTPARAARHGTHRAASVIQ